MALATVLALLLLGPGEESHCLILATTGTACPGCGMTRASAALLRGDWEATWRLHPLAPFLAAEILGLWVIWGWTVFVRRQRMNDVALLYLLVGNFVAFVLVWLVRLLAGSLPG